MKIWVILGLVAGPLVVRGQRADHDRPGAEAAGGWLKPAELFRAWSWPDDHRQVLMLDGRDSLRMLLPDRMPCLSLRRMTDRMPVRKLRLCCGVEKMPNALTRQP